MSQVKLVVVLDFMPVINNTTFTLKLSGIMVWGNGKGKTVYGIWKKLKGKRISLEINIPVQEKILLLNQRNMLILEANCFG